MLTLLITLACTNTEKETGELTETTGVELIAPPADGEGFQLAMDYVVEPYTEIWQCDVYRLPTETISNINSIEFQQNEGMHHMTISTTGFTGGQIEPGSYDCNSLYEDQMDSLLMMFGSQGDAHDLLELPEGVVAQVPADIDIIHEIHYVNTTDQTIDLYSRVNAYTIPDSEVTSGIWGGNVRDEHINIPANETHTEWTRCVMNEDIEVLFLASHMHQLGVEFNIRLFDGTESGEIFYTNDDWHNPKITKYDTPISIPAGSGFEYSCTWTNPHDYPINYGLTSDDEMCNLTYVHTPYSMSAQCTVVETSDGVLWEGK